MKPANDKQEFLAKLAQEFERQLLEDSRSADQPGEHVLQAGDEKALNEKALNEDALTDADLNELQSVKEALEFLESAKQARHQIGQQLNECDDTHRHAEQNTMDAAATAASSHQDEFPNIGRYEIVRAIGEGGFARVFLARDPELDRFVALKIPKPGSLISKEARFRFQREAHAAAMLSHPAIVPVFETNSEGPISWIASEYCEGSTLAEWLRQQGSGPFEGPHLREAAAIVERLAEAMQHAHARTVIHRDLKPENFLVRSGDGCISQRIQVTDFGLARHLDSGDATITVAGAIMGTPAYMSPEQARGESELTASTDIYSLGVILYELMTGQRPFSRSGHIATLKAIESEQPPSPRKLNSDIPRDLEAICLKAMSKEPTRYSHAIEMAEDLQRWRECKPIQARPITSLKKLVRWSRRNPLPAGALSFAVCSLVVGFSIAFWQWSNSNRSSNVAETQTNRAAGHLTRVAGIVDKLLDEIENSGHAGQVTNEQRTRLNDVLRIQEELIVDEADDPASLRNTIRAYTNVTRIHRVLGEYEKCQVTAAQGQDWLEGLEGWERGEADIDREMLGLIIDMQLERTQSCNKSNRGDEGIKATDWLETMLNGYSFLVTERETLYYRLVFASHRGLALKAAKQPQAALKEHLNARDDGELLMAFGELNKDEAPAIAANLINLASRLSWLGQKEQSLELYAQAAGILEKQAAKHPGDFENRYTIAITHNNWSGVLYRLGRFEESQAKVDLAIGELENLLRIVPRNQSFLESLAIAFQRSSVLAYKDKRPDDALAISRKVLDLTEQGLGQTLRGSQTLILVCERRSAWLFKNGDLPGALASTKKAIEIGDQVLAEFPDNLDERLRHNRFRYNRLFIEKRLHNYEDFLADVDHVFLETEKLMSQGPTESWMRFLAGKQVWSFQAKLLILGQLGRWDEAIVAAERVFQVESEKSNSGVRRFQGGCDSFR